jgi:hypothetical protein
VCCTPHSSADGGTAPSSISQTHFRWKAKAGAEDPDASPASMETWLSLAAARGSWVAVVSTGGRRGGQLHLLHVDPASGDISERYAGNVLEGGIAVGAAATGAGPSSSSASSASQMSLLTLLVLEPQGLPGSSHQPEPNAASVSATPTGLHVAVGDWAGSRLLLFRVSDLISAGAASSPLAAVSLSMPGETPRSVAVLPPLPPPRPPPLPASDPAREEQQSRADSATVLLVGTNSGLVLMWEVVLHPSLKREGGQTDQWAFRREVPSQVNKHAHSVHGILVA